MYGQTRCSPMVMKIQARDRVKLLKSRACAQTSVEEDKPEVC